MKIQNKTKTEEEKMICGRCQREWEETEEGNCIHCNCMTAEVQK